MSLDNNVAAHLSQNLAPQPVMPPAPVQPPQKGHFLRFDGKYLYWLNKSGHTLRKWSAVSGRRNQKEDYTDKEHQSIRNKGPLPEGKWRVPQIRYQARNQSMWGNFVSNLGRGTWPGGYHAWGNHRVWLHPLTGTNTYGRSGFSIHGGVVAASAGCIDLSKTMPEFIKKFINYDHDMILTVEYE